jgi:hypothetical protein
MEGSTLVVLYTPQGEGLCYLILFLYTLTVVYRGGGLNVRISWKDVEEMLLSATIIN